MVTIYTTNSCASCRKAIKWLKENNIKYKEINFFTTPLKRSDILAILDNSLNGFEDIISTRSKVFTESNLNIDDMKFNELIDFIIEHPSILKRPIIIDDRNIQVGYNDEEIRTFIPAEVRRKWMCTDCKGCAYQENLTYALEKVKEEFKNENE